MMMGSPVGANEHAQDFRTIGRMGESSDYWDGK